MCPHSKKHLGEFLKEYDDHIDDKKYYCGNAFAHRRREREVEIDEDDRDRARRRKRFEMTGECMGISV